MRETTLDVKAAIRDLSHRVAGLEGILHGNAILRERSINLIRMYLDAHKQPDLRNEAMVGAWLRQTYLLDVQALILLGRAVYDDYPWRPFLVHLDTCVDLGFDGAVLAREYLLGIVRDLLDMMGLQILEPYDLMGKLRIREALTAIRG